MNKFLLTTGSVGCEHNSAYNVGLRLVCNADDSVKGTVTTREAANAGANKATGKGKALIIFYS